MIKKRKLEVGKGTKGLSSKGFFSFCKCKILQSTICTKTRGRNPLSDSKRV